MTLPRRPQQVVSLKRRHRDSVGNNKIRSRIFKTLRIVILLEIMVFFWPSSAVVQSTARLEQLKQAESLLIEFARRYAVGDFDIRPYDTTIPRSCIPSLKPSQSEGEDLVIHAIHVQDKEDGTGTRRQRSQYPLVALHGYYNGAAYYYRNLLGLARYFQNVYSLDALGWGLSSRPRYDNLKNNQSIESAEEWFVESLEAWRKKNEIEKMVLLGHSFGGYMSVAYAERYPERVDRLLLLSPVGVPDETDPSFLERKQRLTSSISSRMFVGVFQTLFEWTTVGGVLRNVVSQERAYDWASRYVQRRLPSINALDEQEAVTDYLYSNAMAPSSGENAIHAILTKNIMAKQPLVHRIPKLKVENIRFVTTHNSRTTTLWMVLDSTLFIIYITACSMDNTTGWTCREA